MRQRTAHGTGTSVPVAAAARAAGIVIYCIGLIGADGIDVGVLDDWATDPDSSHVAVTPDDAELEDLFADLAANISKPGATEIVIDEDINPDFQIVSVSQPTKGTALMFGPTSIQWKISELGVYGNEGAALEFYIRHISQSAGTKQINESIVYMDAEGNAVTFPAHSYPSCRDVLVKCIKFVLPEDLNVSGGNCPGLCSARKFKVRVIAHNVDTDFRCCETTVTV